MLDYNLPLYLTSSHLRQWKMSLEDAELMRLLGIVLTIDNGYKLEDDELRRLAIIYDAVL